MYSSAPPSTSDRKRQRSRVVDLGFAAICFAAFLSIFGLGTNQTPDTIEAANAFAICIPLLVGSAILASHLSQMEHQQPNLFRGVVVIALGLVGVAGSSGGFIGLYHMFEAVSPTAASHFARVSLAVLVFGVVWMKVEVVLDELGRKKKSVFVDESLR